MSAPTLSCHPSKLSWLFLLLVLACATVPAQAADLASPSGEVVLTITGDIARTNADGRADFDMEMLQRLPVTVIETSTPWTDGVVHFTGASLADLLDHIGVTEGTLTASALNQYVVDIPVSDAAEAGPIIAYLRDGAPMTVRERGPIWVIYPFDAGFDSNQQLFHNRAIWQLRQIEVRAP